MLIFIGVLVSPSAKNARARMLTVENATSPGARQISAKAARSVEAAVNCAVLEQQPHNRLGQHDEQDGGDQIQKNQRAQAVPQRGAEFGIIFFRRQAGKRRQQIRRQRNAEHALRQFHQPHGAVERRDDAGADQERDKPAPAPR